MDPLGRARAPLSNSIKNVSATMNIIMLADNYPFRIFVGLYHSITLAVMVN